MDRLISVYDAKSKLSQLLHFIEETGEPITICRNGKPIVDVVRHRETRNPLEQHAKLAGAHYLDDQCGGVDERDWPAEER